MEKYLPASVFGWIAEDTVVTYDSQTIFDYINGAGEVYLLYDFQNVLTKRYTKPKEQDITVEIFDMGSPEDAYGIYSHSHERNDSLVGQQSDFRGSLMCFWKSRYYICISAAREQEKSNQAILELAETIADSIPEQGWKPRLVEYLPEDGLRPNSIKFFHKYTSLNYHYYLSENNILNLDENTDAVLAIYDPGRAHLFYAGYDQPADADSAYQSFIESYIPEANDGNPVMIKENKWVYATAHDNYVIIAFDTPTEERAVELVESVKSNIVD